MGRDEEFVLLGIGRLFTKIYLLLLFFFTKRQFRCCENYLQPMCWRKQSPENELNLKLLFWVVYRLLVAGNCHDTSAGQIDCFWQPCPLLHEELMEAGTPVPLGEVGKQKWDLMEEVSPSFCFLLFRSHRAKTSLSSGYGCCSFCACETDLIAFSSHLKLK